MKVFMISVCAVLASASAGSVSWPGAVSSLSRQTVLSPRQGKSYGFATTQYINTIPSTVPFAFQPQLQYQVPHYSPFVPIHHGFYHIPGSPYLSETLYPSYPGLVHPPTAIPGIPVQPIAGFPSQPIAGFPNQPIAGFPSPPITGFPSQPVPSPPVQDLPSQPSDGGDADTAVVDSIEFPNQEQSQGEPSQEQQSSTETPQQEKPSTPQQDESPKLEKPQLPQGQAPSFPPFPTIPQGNVEFPSFPSIQFPQGSLPTYPQIPQGPLPGYPQFPQGSLPTKPQLPQFPSYQPGFPQSPSFSPPASYPGTSNEDKGLNDEDTVSIESA